MDGHLRKAPGTCVLRIKPDSCMGRDVSECQKGTSPNHIRAFILIIDYLVMLQKGLFIVCDSYVNTVSSKV